LIGTGSSGTLEACATVHLGRVEIEFPAERRPVWALPAISG